MNRFPTIHQNIEIWDTDRLNKYIKHIGSALFAVPRGPRTGSYIAAELFG